MERHLQEQTELQTPSQNVLEGSADSTIPLACEASHLLGLISNASSSVKSS